jgi:hypothetical protein
MIQHVDILFYHLHSFVLDKMTVPEAGVSSLCKQNQFPVTYHFSSGHCSLYHVHQYSTRTVPVKVSILKVTVFFSQKNMCILFPFWNFRTTTHTCRYRTYERKMYAVKTSRRQLTSQAMYVQRNTEAPATIVVMKSNEYYTNCVCILALGIQHSMRIRHNIICCLPCSTLFFHIISQREQFLKKSC